MKKLILFSSLLCLVLSSGCVARVEKETTGDSEVYLERIATLEDKVSELEGELEGMEPAETLIEPSTVGDRTESMTKLEEYVYDIDRDGTAEDISLYTDAVKDDQGRMMWDDGHNFLLVVRDGGDDYVLFDGYVQIGRLYFMVYAGEVGEPSGVISMVSTFSGMIINKYFFDDGGSLHSMVLFDSGGMNVVHSTVPWD